MHFFFFGFLPGALTGCRCNSVAVDKSFLARHCRVINLHWAMPLALTFLRLPWSRSSRNAMQLLQEQRQPMQLITAKCTERACEMTDRKTLIRIQLQTDAVAIVIRTVIRDYYSLIHLGFYYKI